MQSNWWGELVEGAKSGINDFVNEITQDDEEDEPEAEHYQAEKSESAKSPVQSSALDHQSTDLLDTISRLTNENEKNKRELLQERQKVADLQKEVHKAALDSQSNESESTLVEENKKLRRRLKKAQNLKKQFDILKEKEKKSAEELALAQHESNQHQKQLEIATSEAEKFKEQMKKERDSTKNAELKHVAEMDKLREEHRTEIQRLGNIAEAETNNQQIEELKEAHANELSSLKEQLQKEKASYEEQIHAIRASLEQQRISLEKSLTDERAALEGSLSNQQTLEKERTRLEEELKEKHTQMDELLGERKSFEEKLSEFQNSLADAEGSLHEKDNHIARLNEKVADLEKYVQQLSSKEQDHDLVKRIRELTEKCDEKDNKFESLQKELEVSVSIFKKSEEGLNYEATNLRKNVSDLTAQIEELRGSKAKIETELESSKSNLASTIQTCDALKRDITSLTQEKEILVSEKSSHSAIVQSLQNVIEQTRSKASSEAEQQEHLIQEKHREVELLNCRLLELEAELKDAQADMSRVVEGTSEEETALTSKIAELEAERDTQKQHIESLQATMAEDSERADQMTLEISRLQSEKSELDQAMHSLQDTIQAYQHDIQELEVWRSNKLTEIHELEEAGKQQKKEITSLRERLEGGLEQTDGLSSRISEIEAEKQTCVVQIKSLQEYLEKSETKNAELRGEHEEKLQAQERAFEEKIQLMKMAHEEALSSVIPETDNAKLEQIQSELSESIIKEKKLQTQASALQNQIVAYKTQLEANKEHLVQVEKQNRELQTQNSALEESYERVTLDQKDSKNEIHQLQEALHEARASSQDIIDDLHEELNTKETRINLLISQRDNLKQQMTQQWNEDSAKEANVGQALQERERELTLLKSQLASLDREYQDLRTKSFRETKSLEQTLVDLQRTCHKKNAEIEALESLRVDYEDSQRHLAEKRKENQRHQAALENMESVVSTLTEERDMLRQQTIEMENDHHHRKITVEQQQSDLNGANSRVKDLSTENKKLREKYQRAHKHSRKLEDDNDSLRKALQKFTQRETKLIDEDSVDRRLVNKLLTTFLSKEGDQRNEVLRLLVNILKFSPEEQQIVYAYQNQSVIGGLFGGLFGGPSPSESPPEVPDVSDKRIGDLFFDFLIKELGEPEEEVRLGEMQNLSPLSSPSVASGSSTPLQPNSPT